MNTTTKILRTLRIVTAPLIAAVFILAAVLTPAGSANASALPWCRLGAMRLTLSHLVGQAGNVGVTLTATNTSHAACTLSGYPQPGLVRVDGQAVAPVVTDGPTWFHVNSKPVTVVLREGGRGAVAFLGWADPGSGPEITTSELTIGLRRSPFPQAVAALPFLARVRDDQMAVTRWAAPTKEK